jgi:hypothetical protein
MGWVVNNSTPAIPAGVLLTVTQNVPSRACDFTQLPSKIKSLPLFGWRQGYWAEE